MPSCRPDVISGVLYKVMDIKPGTILDVGVGHGKWSILCDEYLRYWTNLVPKIDGVEIFENYKSPAYGVYNEIFNCDVMSLVEKEKIQNYDMVLIIDVIEHLSKENGFKLLEKCNKYIVSTPNYWLPQGSSFGNDHEKHISKWDGQDFENHTIVQNVVGGEHILGWK